MYLKHNFILKYQKNKTYIILKQGVPEDPLTLG